MGMIKCFTMHEHGGRGVERVGGGRGRAEVKGHLRSGLSLLQSIRD